MLICDASAEDDDKAGYTDDDDDVDDAVSNCNGNGDARNVYQFVLFVNSASIS